MVIIDILRGDHIIVYRPTYKSKLIVKIERRSIVLKAYASLDFTKAYKKVNIIGFSEIWGGGGCVLVAPRGSATAHIQV